MTTWLTNGSPVSVSESTEISCASTVNKFQFVGALGISDAYMEVSGLSLQSPLHVEFSVQKISQSGYLIVTNPEDATKGTWEVDLSKVSTSLEKITSAHDAVYVVFPFYPTTGGDAGIQFSSGQGTISFYICGEYINYDIPSTPWNRTGPTVSVAEDDTYTCPAGGAVYKFENVGALNISDTWVDILGFDSYTPIDTVLDVRKTDTTGILLVTHPSDVLLGMWEVDFSLLSASFEEVSEDSDAVTVIYPFSTTGTGAGGIKLSSVGADLAFRVCNYSQSLYVSEPPPPSGEDEGSDVGKKITQLPDNLYLYDDTEYEIVSEGLSKKTTRSALVRKNNFGRLQSDDVAGFMLRIHEEVTAAELNYWHDVVWSPKLGIFCAVSTNGTNRVMTSPDGENWTAVAAVAANEWRAICWSPDLEIFAAVSSTGNGTNSVMTSANGSTWTSRSAPNKLWWDIEWSPYLGLFCAVSKTLDSQPIMTSPDGVTWTLRNAPGRAYTSVAWSDFYNRFVAVHDAAGSLPAIKSEDGVSWADVGPMGLQATKIIWARGLNRFFVVASSGTQISSGVEVRAYSSFDGQNWDFLLVPTIAWQDIVWVEELHLLVAVSSNGAGTQLMRSYDGVNWDLISTPGSNQYRGISFSPELGIFASVAITGSNSVLINRPGGLSVSGGGGGGVAGDVTYVGSGGANVANATSLQISSVPISGGSDRAFAAIIGTEAVTPGDDVPTACTINGVGMTNRGTIYRDKTTSTGRLRFTVYDIDHATMPSSGSYTLSISTAGQCDFIGAGWFMLEGVDAIEGYANVAGLGPSIANPIFITTANCMVIDGCLYSNGNSRTVTPNDGQIERLDQTGRATMGCGTAQRGASGLYGSGWTASTAEIDDVVAIALSYQPVYAGGGGNDLPPFVDAGQPQTVSASSTVTLSGIGYDPDGGQVTYLWSQISGTTVTINNSTQAVANFTAPSTSGTLTFQLQVTDDETDVTTDQTTVTVQATPPPPGGGGIGVFPGTQRRFAPGIWLVGQGGTTPNGWNSIWNTWCEPYYQAWLDPSEGTKMGLYHPAFALKNFYVGSITPNNASNPNDPAYDWSYMDAQLASAPIASGKATFNWMLDVEGSTIPAWMANAGYVHQAASKEVIDFTKEGLVQAMMGFWDAYSARYDNDNRIYTAILDEDNSGGGVDENLWQANKTRVYGHASQAIQKHMFVVTWNIAIIESLCVNYEGIHPGCSDFRAFDGPCGTYNHPAPGGYDCESPAYRAMQRHNCSTQNPPRDPKAALVLPISNGYRIVGGAGGYDPPNVTNPWGELLPTPKEQPANSDTNITPAIYVWYASGEPRGNNKNSGLGQAGNDPPGVIPSSWIAIATTGIRHANETPQDWNRALRLFGAVGTKAIPALPYGWGATPATWRPTQSDTWEYQIEKDPLNTNINVDIYIVDVEIVSAAEVTTLKNQGKRVIGYFSAGTFENFRGDAGSFPSSVKGNVVDGFPDERWLDIRQLDILRPIMVARMQTAISKGITDGVDPDNMDGYHPTNSAGFPMDYNDQLVYNRMIAQEAHNLGFAVGLKNNIEQIQDLVNNYDFAVNEQCFQFNECGAYAPFTNAGKAVFNVEYGQKRCAEAAALNFYHVRKTLVLDDFRDEC